MNTSTPLPRTLRVTFTTRALEMPLLSINGLSKWTLGYDEPAAGALSDGCQSVVSQLPVSCCRSPSTACRGGRSGTTSQRQVRCQTVVSQLSVSCQSVVSQLPVSCQSVVSQWSVSCQSVASQLPVSCQSVASQLPVSCQSVVSQLSVSCCRCPSTACPSGRSGTTSQRQVRCIIRPIRHMPYAIRHTIIRSSQGDFPTV
jgi:hypothetical protein